MKKSLSIITGLFVMAAVAVANPFTARAEGATYRFTGAVYEVPTNPDGSWSYNYNTLQELYNLQQGGNTILLNGKVITLRREGNSISFSRNSEICDPRASISANAYVEDFIARDTCGDSLIAQALNKSTYAEAMSAVKNIVATVVTPGMTEYEKAVALTNWVNAHSVYDASNPRAHDAVAALIDGRSVCQGFTEAKYLLYREAGLMADMILCDNANHVVVVVKAAGNWYLSSNNGSLSNPLSYFGLK